MSRFHEPVRSEAHDQLPVPLAADGMDGGGTDRNTAVPAVTSFDRLDHHEYGLIRISATEYVRCTGDCCKSGGPVHFTGMEF